MYGDRDRDGIHVLHVVCIPHYKGDNSVIGKEGIQSYSILQFHKVWENQTSMGVRTYSVSAAVKLLHSETKTA